MRPSYFLVAVSNRQNLETCIKYGLAGFPNSNNGVWTFYEIEEGDYISFLFGARVYNLYKVVGKEALKDAEDIPPWPKLTFQESGLTYYFPFRLILKPIRKLEESLVRPEFAYVAENLLLRAGYRKTHFQADQTTLQNISQLGELWDSDLNELEIPEYDTYHPAFSRKKVHIDNPTVFSFRELILQTLIRHSLGDEEYLQQFIKGMLGVTGLDLSSLEILGEKAVPEGHIDLLIKEAIPIGHAKKIILEVKLSRSTPSDIKQLKGYMKELGKEYVAGAIIAERFSKSMKAEVEGTNITLVEHSFPFDWDVPRDYYFMLPRLNLEADYKF